MFAAPHLSLSRRGLLALALGAAVAPIGRAAAQDQRQFTFLVLGLDTREQNTDQRSDTIMVARVDLDAPTVRTLSIPRDLYVEIPGYGDDKINAAYQRGLTLSPDLDWEIAAGLTAQTVTHNFGVPIDGTAMTDMNRFPAIIDAVGGVDVDNPYAFYDDTYFKRGFPAGNLQLNGADALVFCRIRVPDGDGGRVMRQHLVLEALLQKLRQPDMLARIPELIAALDDAVKTDIPLDVRARLLAALPNIQPENLSFTNIEELLWSDYTAEGAWIYQGDWSTLPGYVQAWLSGEID